MHLNTHDQVEHLCWKIELIFSVMEENEFPKVIHFQMSMTVLLPKCQRRHKSEKLRILEFPSGARWPKESMNNVEIYGCFPGIEKAE